MYFSLPRYSFIEPCKVFLFAFFFIMFLNLAAAPLSFSQIVNKNKMKCNCVIFRLDDVQDNYHDQSQLALMNFFLEKNQSLSLGLIANAFGNDSIVLNEVRTGFDAGKFELASHGWNHEDFTKLSEHTQTDLLNKSIEKIHKVFGTRPAIFIPPMFEFNNATLDAMRHLGIKIISSNDTTYFDRNQSHLVANITYSKYTGDDNILHFPSTVQYSKYVINKSKTPPIEQWNTIPVEKLLTMINNSISNYGYAIVTTHPQEFVISKNGVVTDTLNVAKLNDLHKLVNTIIDRNIRLITFNKLVNISSDLVNSTALS